jgi:hypothetical protein
MISTLTVPAQLPGRHLTVMQTTQSGGDFDVSVCSAQ